MHACGTLIVLKEYEPTFTEQRTTDIYTHTHIHIYENRQFDSLVWSSLTLAPIIYGVYSSNVGCSIDNTAYSGKFTLVQIFAEKRPDSSEEIFAVFIFAERWTL